VTPKPGTRLASSPPLAWPSAAKPAWSKLSSHSNSTMVQNALSYALQAVHECRQRTPGGAQPVEDGVDRVRRTYRLGGQVVHDKNDKSPGQHSLDFHRYLLPPERGEAASTAKNSLAPKPIPGSDIPRLARCMHARRRQSAPGDHRYAVRRYTGGGLSGVSVQAQDAGRVAVQDLFPDLGGQFECVQFVQAALRGEEREIAAPQELAGQPAAQLADDLRRDALG
jgi:hypothetical protein